MQRLLILFVLMFCACAGTNKKEEAEQTVTIDSVATTMANEPEMLATTCSDSLVMDFLDLNPQLKGYNDTPHLSWIYDRIEVTDTATYLVTRIGHSFEYRYQTSAWIYIDTVKCEWHEYDVVEDMLVNYNKKLRYLFFANGGLLGFYDDGTVAGCPRCDLDKNNIAVMIRRKPHLKYELKNEKLILSDGTEMVPDTTLEFKEWAMIDYNWVIEPE